MQINGEIYSIDMLSIDTNLLEGTYEMYVCILFSFVKFYTEMRL